MKVLKCTLKTPLPYIDIRNIKFEHLFWRKMSSCIWASIYERNKGGRQWYWVRKRTNGFETIIICIKFRYGILFLSFGFKSTRISCQKFGSSVVHESFLFVIFYFQSVVSTFTHHSIMSCLKNDHIVTTVRVQFFSFMSNLSNILRFYCSQFWKKSTSITKLFTS